MSLQTAPRVAPLISVTRNRSLRSSERWFRRGMGLVEFHVLFPFLRGFAMLIKQELFSGLTPHGLPAGPCRVPHAAA
jgi:hypothetical protein